MIGVEFTTTMLSKSGRENTEVPSPQVSLGRLLKVYRGHPIRASETLVFLGLVVGAVFGPLGFGIWRLIYGYTQYGPASAISWSRPWFITTAIGAIPILILLTRRIRIARISVRVHERGIAIDRLFSKPNQILWSDISSVSTTTIQERFLGITYANTNKFSLSLQNRKRIYFDGNIQCLSELSDRIKSMIYPHLLRQYRGKVNIGQHINFGDIILSSNGLHVNGNDFHWKSIQHVGVHSGSVVIELMDARKQRYPVSSIPNVEILLQLIEEITQE